MGIRAPDEKGHIFPYIGVGSKFTNRHFNAIKWQRLHRRTKIIESGKFGRFGEVHGIKIFDFESSLGNIIRDRAIKMAASGNFAPT
jgi:hypothetical protein